MYFFPAKPMRNIFKHIILWDRSLIMLISVKEFHLEIPGHRILFLFREHQQKNEEKKACRKRRRKMMPKNDPEMSVLDADFDSQGAGLYWQNLAFPIYNA
mgnify:CR=1 FL=1